MLEFNNPLPMSKNNKSAAAAQGAAAAQNIEVSAPVSAAPAEKKESKVVASVAKVAFFTPLIEEKKYSAKELTEMALQAFPKLTESTIRTFLTDSKNAKYNKFPKLVVVTEDKKLAFAV